MGPTLAGNFNAGGKRKGRIVAAALQATGGASG